MRLVGLTGGIASGKSTVSRMLQALGAPIIDADVLAREVVTPGQPALAQIAKRFPNVIGPGGTLDRKALGTKIFGNKEERQALNAIVHPYIQKAFQERLQNLKNEGQRFAIYDAALLIENQLHQQMDAVLLVYVPYDVQLWRLMTRDALTKEEAAQRLGAQMSLEDKRPFATWVLDNRGTLENTQAQVNKLWPDIVGRSAEAPHERS